MRTLLKAALPAAALVASLSLSASAADLHHGSVKDRIAAPNFDHFERPAIGGARGPCYVRGDMGYSVGRNPNIKFPISNTTWNYRDAEAAAAADRVVGAAGTTVTRDANGAVILTPPPGTTLPAHFDPNAFWNRGSQYIGDTVTHTSMENAWNGGFGIGCGSASWGLRGELMLSATGARKIDGEPLFYLNPAQPLVGVAPSAPGLQVDPLHTSLKSYTAMVNVYKDLGTYRGFTPYVGFGVGVAHNTLSEVFFTGNPDLTAKIEGASRLSLAWGLMAGVGVTMSERATLDLGYRYMDYGKANSGRVDNAGFVNPAVRIDDITAHEFRVGLRYNFGKSDCCDAAPSYSPMK